MLVREIMKMQIRKRGKLVSYFFFVVVVLLCLETFGSIFAICTSFFCRLRGSNIMVVEGAVEINLKGLGKIVSVCD